MTVPWASVCNWGTCKLKWSRFSSLSLHLSMHLSHSLSSLHSISHSTSYFLLPLPSLPPLPLLPLRPPLPLPLPSLLHLHLLVATAPVDQSSSWSRVSTTSGHPQTEEQPSNIHLYRQSRGWCHRHTHSLTSGLRLRPRQESGESNQSDLNVIMRIPSLISDHTIHQHTYVLTPYPSLTVLEFAWANDNIWYTHCNSFLCERTILGPYPKL